MGQRPRSDCVYCLTSLVMLALATQAHGEEFAEPIEGFLAPYRSVDVATAETGIVREILVREGDAVEEGQSLARLDDDVHAAVVAEAEQAMQAEGRLEAARAELQLRQERLSALRLLMPRGSARPEEVERAQADADIAAAQLRAARDELSVKRLEYERVMQLWQRRTVQSPLAGVVVARFKEEGEFIGPNDPQLLTIMQLDPLLATFAVPSRQARQMCIGQSVKIRILEAGDVVDGSVRHIAPVIDGRSGTRRVEVRVDNAEHRFLSGEPCSLLLK